MQKGYSYDKEADKFSVGADGVSVYGNSGDGTELAMESDILVEMITYSYSLCATCDYKTKEYYQGTKYKVTCSLSPAGFWARPGQTIQQGYDVHECYSSWGL